MTIETDIVNWARTRPTWQRAILRRVARGDHLDDKDYCGIVDKLCEAVWKGSEAFEISDFPATSPSAGQVSILAIKDIDKVNALVKGQELRFAPEGLTLVFGENGSGKSGYARLIKAMVRTRHREGILTDIFSDAGTGTATAVITLQTDGDVLDVSWPEGDRSGSSTRFCSTTRLAATRTSPGRPRPRTARIRSSSWTGSYARGMVSARNWIDASPETAVKPSRFRSSTNVQPPRSCSRDYRRGRRRTTLKRRAICPMTWPFKSNALSRRRRGSRQPTRPRKRPDSRQQHDTSKLAEHVAEFSESLGDETTACLREAHTALRTARAASMLASEESFEDEPIGGVGTAAWRSLWEAARHFAVERVLDFPPASPHARCVLCHQELDEKASDRLKRFDAFIKNETQQNLDAATKAWKYAVRRIETLDTTPAQVLSALDTLGDEHSDLIERYRSAMHTCVERRDQLLKQHAGEPWSEPATPLPKVPENDLAERANKLRAKAGGIDDESFAKEIESAASERRELEAKVELAKYRKFLVAEVQRLRELEKLEQVKEQADTRGVSRKAAEITREHVTTVMRDRFTRETERLRLERVTLADAGGPKGALRHQPAFVGAIQRAPLPRVLSEGEQTALGLAGFFTEAYLV